MAVSSSASGSTPQATLISLTGVSLVKRQQRQRRPQPRIEPWVFRAERELAFSPDAPTGLVLLDRSQQLRLAGPGTTPSLLAGYVVVRARQQLRTRFRGGREFYFVIHGEGQTVCGDQSVSWQTGDAFYWPGGHELSHHASSDSRLYVLTDQPLADFLGLQSMQLVDQPLHYKAADIREAQDRDYRQTGKSGVVHFGLDDRIVYSSFVPCWKWLKPGEAQLSHRHAAVAVQLFVSGRNCYSVIDDQRVQWEDYTVAITPPGSLHCHGNEGDDVGVYLVAQDLPLYRYLRTYWHEEPETDVCLQDWRQPEAQ
ncbi:cupin domain-containing protein [Synechococcus sp. CBW1004]|uniref:cupin domain-containing protein n=1 Tax=Synechococcus sp. CBW1004 TaxID=1353136 RepID=UPI001E6032BC|nr:cupin domain-containing protein [Synechococcus sp. CBW1004]